MASNKDEDGIIGTIRKLSKIKQKSVALKACVRNLLFFFIFSGNGSPLKTMKNLFYFTRKALFVLEIFKFLYFFLFLSTVSRFKRTNESGIIYDVIN